MWAEGFALRGWGVPYAPRYMGMGGFGVTAVGAFGAKALRSPVGFECPQPPWGIWL